MKKTLTGLALANIGHAAILGGLWGMIVHSVFGYDFNHPQYWLLLFFGAGLILTLTDIAHDKKEN